MYSIGVRGEARRRGRRRRKEVLGDRASQGWRYYLLVKVGVRRKRRRKIGEEEEEGARWQSCPGLAMKPFPAFRCFSTRREQIHICSTSRYGEYHCSFTESCLQCGEVPRRKLVLLAFGEETWEIGRGPEPALNTYVHVAVVRPETHGLR